jgi:hypothetical protein
MSRVLAVVAALSVLPVLGSAATQPAGRRQAWEPRRCVTDTLTVIQDSARVETADTIAPGLLYRCILDRRGPWVIHAVSIDLANPRLVIDGARALDAYLGRETVTGMAARLTTAGRLPLVGVNGDFFDTKTGEVENNHVIGGEWVKGADLTDSPHDTFDNAHTQFARDVRGRPLIGRFQLQATAVSGGRAEPIVGINYRPALRAGLVLFTPWYGARTPTDTTHHLTPPQTVDSSTPPPIAELRADSARRLSSAATRQAVEVTLRRIGRRGDTVLYRATQTEPSSGGGALIPRFGGVLSATEGARQFAEEAARTGAVVKVVSRLDPWPFAPRTVVGGWPRIVGAGQNVAHAADSTEGTFPRFSASRHPRSALGLSADSTTLYIVVVDGRRPWSVGMSLVELGDAMLALGAHDAMNLDGGGSSTLWVTGRTVNAPSDVTGERAVGNALFVFRR